MYRPRIRLIIALLLMLSAFGALGYWVVGRAKEEAETFTRLSLQRLSLAGQINAYQAEGYVRALLLLNAEAPAERAELHAAIEEYRLKNDVALQAYTSALTSDEGRQQLQALTEKREEYRRIRDQVVALSDQGQKDEALQLARHSLWPAYQAYTLAGDVILDGDIADARQHADYIRRVCAISQILAALVAAFGFLGGIALPLTLVWLNQRLADEEPLHP